VIRSFRSPYVGGSTIHSNETTTTAEEFDESLNEVIRAAYENGADVEGGSVGARPTTPTGTS
jgi:hypothetical protein